MWYFVVVWLRLTLKKNKLVKKQTSPSFSEIFCCTYIKSVIFDQKLRIKCMVCGTRMHYQNFFKVLKDENFLRWQNKKNSDDRKYKNKIKLGLSYHNLRQQNHINHVNHTNHVNHANHVDHTNHVNHINHVNHEEKSRPKVKS